jgi:hypothetical protein
MVTSRHRDLRITTSFAARHMKSPTSSPMIQYSIEELKNAVTQWALHCDRCCNLQRSSSGPEYAVRRLQEVLLKDQMTRHPKGHSRLRQKEPGTAPQNWRCSTTGLDIWYATSFLRRYLQAGRQAFELADEDCDGADERDEIKGPQQHLRECLLQWNALVGEQGPWRNFQQACSPFENMIEMPSHLECCPTSKQLCPDSAIGSQLSESFKDTASTDGSMEDATTLKTLLPPATVESFCSFKARMDNLHQRRDPSSQTDMTPTIRIYPPSAYTPSTMFNMTAPGITSIQPL